MNTLSHLAAVLLSSSVMAGCAHSGAASNRYLHGRPSEYTLPAPVDAAASEADLASTVRRLQAEATREPTVAAPTVEATDVELRDALAVAAAAPSSESHRRAAAQFLRVGITDQAADHLSAAIALDPRDAAAYEMLARLWRDWGFPGEALGDAHRAAYYAPDSAASHNTLGTVLHRLGRYADARGRYEQALILDPTAVYALNNLCAVALDQGDGARAVAACRRALDLDPGMPAATRNLDRARRMTSASPSKESDERH